MDNTVMIIDLMRSQTIKMLPIETILKVYFNKYTYHSWNKYLEIYINVIIQNNQYFIKLNNNIINFNIIDNKIIDINDFEDYFKLKNKIFNDYISLNLKLKLLVLKIFRY